MLCECQEVGEDNSARRFCLELGQAQIGHEAIVDREVVTDDDDAVARGLHIAFDRIRTFAERSLECWPAVVRMPRAAASMGNDLRSSHAASSAARPRTVDRTTSCTGTIVSPCGGGAPSSMRRRSTSITALVNFATG